MYKTIFELRTKVAAKLCHNGSLKNCARKHIKKNPFGISPTKACDFERNLDLKIRCEERTSGRQTQGDRRLLLTSDIHVEISLKIDSFYGSGTQNK